uniref:Uncharacterized protein n=1 Tax=Erpetoichthys calabaricus TaxID=27687 RepID=A0A8C4SCX2_ERPCA
PGPGGGSKVKLPQTAKTSNSPANAGGKHSGGKRRTSSEDSSLEPDLAELSLDDGSSLALGAEASNTFDLLPSPSSPVLREPRRYSVKDSVCQGKRNLASAGPHTELVKDPSSGEQAESEGQDDYQMYYPSAASEEGAEQGEGGCPDGNPEEELDIFDGIKPLEQEGRMEILFASAEALHAHGYSNEACHLAVELAKDLLANPPDLKVEQAQSKGKKSKVSTSRQTQVATSTLSKAAFLLPVLSEWPEHHNLAFSVGMFSLELQRPPASTKALEVKLAYQESEIVALLKKIPLGAVEMNAIRDRAEQLRDGSFCDYRPVLPLMLASFIFDVLCTPGQPPSRNRNNEMPGDEELGFEAAVAALGMIFECLCFC